MDWINTVLPVVTLIIGWALSEYGKFSTDRKNDKKKLKRLLFNLLEIRWLLKRGFEIKNEISTYLERFEIKLKNKFGPDAAQETYLIEPIITEILRDKLVKPDRVKEIETRIDDIIDELSEIYPIFAYELTEVHRIRERIEGIEAYFEEISERIEQMPQEIKDWIRPKFSNELLEQLDDYILKIAGKVSWMTKRNVSKKYLKKDKTKDVEEIDKFLDEFIQKFDS